MPVAIKNVQVNDSDKILDFIVAGAEEKKAHDIVVLDLRPTGSSIADYFVICHGDSRTQVDAIAQSIEDELIKALGEKPVYKEGFTNAEWIVLDYINVVVHVFLKEFRDFYGIERFWADAVSTRVR